MSFLSVSVASVRGEPSPGHGTVLGGILPPASPLSLAGSCPGGGTHDPQPSVPRGSRCHFLPLSIQPLPAGVPSCPSEACLSPALGQPWLPDVQEVHSRAGRTLSSVPGALGLAALLPISR